MLIDVIVYSTKTHFVATVVLKWGDYWVGKLKRTQTSQCELRL